MQQKNIDSFLILTVLIYANRDDSVKRFTGKKFYLSKDIIKNYNFIISENNFYDQPIDSDTKRYEEIIKLTAGQDKDYTKGCWMLLDKEYTRNH